MCVCVCVCVWAASDRPMCRQKEKLSTAETVGLLVAEKTLGVSVSEKPEYIENVGRAKEVCVCVFVCVFVIVCVCCVVVWLLPCVQVRACAHLSPCLASM